MSAIRARSEILSLRLTTEQKSRLTEAAERHGRSLSDYVRECAMRHVDDPAVTPSQNITVRSPSALTDEEIRTWLARVLWKAGVL